MVTTLYFCDVCGSKYQSEKSAKECERLPISNDDLKLDEFYTHNEEMYYIIEKGGVGKNSRGHHHRYYNVLRIGEFESYKKAESVTDDLMSGEDLRIKHFKIASEREIHNIPTKPLYKHITTQWSKDYKPGEKLLSIIKKHEKILQGKAL